MTNTAVVNKKMTPEQLRVWLNQRSSGGSGTHGDRRTRRLRDRGAQQRRAIREG